MKVGRAFWFVLPAWLVPMISLGVYLGLAPNVITRSADVGSFVSAQVRPLGMFTGTTTAVRTTHGVLFVSGIFTAPAGEALVLRDSTEEGVQLCRRGSDQACADLVGHYVGEIPVVAHTWLTYSMRQDLGTALFFWFLLGLTATLLAAVAGTGQGDERAGRT